MSPARTPRTPSRARMMASTARIYGCESPLDDTRPGAVAAEIPAIPMITFADMTTISRESVPAPLTRLAEDEQLLRASVREFAEARIRPHVVEMDEHAKIPRALID